MTVHYIMTMIKKMIVKGQKPTHEQLMELETASKMPIVYDEDSPELTEEQYVQTTETARNRRNAIKKPVKGADMIQQRFIEYSQKFAWNIRK